MSKKPRRVEAKTEEPMHTGGPPAETLPPSPTVEVQPVTIEEKLLRVYANAPLGPMDIKQIAEQLGETIEHLNQAWDRLYDFGKLPYSKFVKQ